MTNAYIMKLGHNTRSKVHKMDIDGIFSVNKIDIARQANIRINTVLQKINGIDIKVFCRADVGADMGLLNHCRKVTDNSVVSLNHEAN